MCLQQHSLCLVVSGLSLNLNDLLMALQRSTVGVAPNNGDNKKKREMMSSVKSGTKKGPKDQKKT